MSGRAFTKATKPTSATSTWRANKPAHDRKPPQRRQAGAVQQDNSPSIHGGAAFDFTKIPLYPPNRAGAQDKLRMGETNSKYEHEADQVADIVMRMPEPSGKEESMTGKVQVRTGSVLREVQRQENREGGDTKPIKAGESKEKPLEERLDEIEHRYRQMIKSARDKGYNVAADNLQKFLDGTGGKKTIDVKWLRGFSAVTGAEQVNQERFETSLTKLAYKLKDGDIRSFSDFWDRKLTASTLTELFYASGTSTITSTGNFSLTRKGDSIFISGTVEHRWWDPYDWHAGLVAFIPGFGVISDEDALLLQRHRRARGFMMETKWRQVVSGRIVIRRGWFDEVDYEWNGP